MIHLIESPSNACTFEYYKFKFEYELITIICIRFFEGYRYFFKKSGNAPAIRPWVKIPNLFFQNQIDFKNLKRMITLKEFKKWTNFV